MELAAIAITCLALTAAILLAMARSARRKRRRAWQAYYSDRPGPRRKR